jgi:hypothetical protein
MFDIEAIPHGEWLHQSEKLINHAGSWSLEYIHDMNRITRVYSTAFTLASLHGNQLQIIILSHTQIERGPISIEGIVQTSEEKIMVTLMVGEISYLIQLHAPGITQEQIDAIQSVQLAELLIDDLGNLHKEFASWVISVIPPAALRSSEELFDHLNDLLKLPFVTYVPAIINKNEQFDALFSKKLIYLPHVTDISLRTC